MRSWAATLRAGLLAGAFALLSVAVATADVKPVVAGDGCPIRMKGEIATGAIAKISLAGSDLDAALAHPVARYGRHDVIREPKRNGHMYVQAYVTTAATTLDVQGNVAKLPKRTFFFLGCYGQQSGGTLYPMLSLRPVYRKVTKASIETSKSRPAAFKTMTLLSGPNGHVAQTLHLTDRRKRSTISSDKVVAITPQVGAQAGACFYPHAGRVWRSGRTKVLRK